MPQKYTHCPNCGAPLQPREGDCPYCGCAYPFSGAATASSRDALAEMGRLRTTLSYLQECLSSLAVERQRLVDQVEKETEAAAPGNPLIGLLGFLGLLVIIPSVAFLTFGLLAGIMSLMSPVGRDDLPQLAILCALPILLGLSGLWAYRLAQRHAAVRNLALARARREVEARQQPALERLDAEIQATRERIARVTADLEALSRHL